MDKSSLRKPDKERIVAAMKGEIPDRVPNFEVCMEPEIVKAILGKDAGSTLAASRGMSDTAYFAPPMNPYDYIEVCNRVGQDVIGFEALWTPLKYKDEKGDLHLITDGRIKNWEEFEKAIKPNWELDYAPRKEYFDEYKKALEGTNVGFFMLTGCVFQTCYQFLSGFSDFFLMVYTDRELVEALLDTCVDYYLKIIDMALDSGLTFLFLGDDIAYKPGTFIDPKLFKEIWLPKYKKLIKPAKEAGVPIMFHSCGNLTNIMDDIIMEMGIDALNPIEPYSMDIFSIKEKYGDRLTISGNIDIAGPLAFGTEEEVKKEVKEHLEKLMVGGRYILSTNHSIMDGIPVKNYLAMLEALFEYGVY
ncbi:MAG: uroporphyrinogen decarboxylase family protein [Mahellales bacterium]